MPVPILMGSDWAARSGCVNSQGLGKHNSGQQEGPWARYRHRDGNGWKEMGLFNKLLKMPSLTLKLGWDTEND